MSECVLWTGACNENGYGKVYSKRTKKMVAAHRLAWSIANHQRIPKGMFVCHRCDNPTCINPDHLFLGDNRDNCFDMINKGRSHRQTRRVIPRKKIREMYAAGRSISEIVKETGTFSGTVRAALKHPVAVPVTEPDRVRKRLKRWGLSKKGAEVYLKAQKREGRRMGITEPHNG